MPNLIFLERSLLLFVAIIPVCGAESPKGSSATQPMIKNEQMRQMYQFVETFDCVFDRPEVIGDSSPYWRVETMRDSNNSGQHRQAVARRHAAWYDGYHDKTMQIRDGCLVQRGYVADADTPGFTSRDSGDAPRNHAYTDPDPRDSGSINFADFEIHTSWLDTFAVKAVKGQQVPVETTDQLLPSKEYWGQPGKTDTRSPNRTFTPGTFFEIEVSFEGMQALGHRHSFWLMPTHGPAAYDDDPSNGLEIDIYEHELALEPNAVEPGQTNLNDVLLMKCIGGKTKPPSTANELREDRGTAINVPGINRGWHRIGLLWTAEQLVWFVDGAEVVKDTKLVPQVEMFLILSREANTGAARSEGTLQADGERIPFDAGLFGRNVAAPANRELIKQGKDEVRVRYVRAWKVQG